MPFCSNCGTEVTDAVNFCSKCGAAMSDRQATSPRPSRTGFVATGAVVRGELDVSRLSDLWVWLLAVGSPTINLALCYVAYSTIHYIIQLEDVSQTMLEQMYWTGTYGTVFIVFFKVLFIILDVIEHRKRGFKLSGVWVAIGFFIPIIYLFVRAKRTNKKYGYAIIGVVLEVLSYMACLMIMLWLNNIPTS